MESFEFLGGRYNRPEQIMSGAVQAFKAQHAGNGKTVFIHRVSTAEAPQEQATLLKLLTTAIIKSPDAQRLVLDFGEERGYWYVVTECEPQCALLREWLQLEIDSALAGGKAGGEPRPTASQPMMPSAPTVREDENPGEFTRFLQSRPQFNPPTFARTTTPRPSASQSSSAKPSPEQPPPTKTSTDHNVSTPPPKDSRHAPPEPFKGEFTQLFQQAEHTGSTLEQTRQAPLAQAQAPPETLSPAKVPPGEFTSLFHPAQMAGPSTNAPLVGTPEAPASNGKGDAPTNSPPGEFTSLFNPTTGSEITPQAPLKPVTKQPPPAVSSPSKAQETGEFTRFFTGGLPASASKPVTNPSVTRAERPSNPYVQRPSTVSPKTYTPPATANKPTPEGGEFTRMFSNSSGAPQRPERVAYKADLPAEPLADMFSNRIEIPQPIAPSRPMEGEFTRMFGNDGGKPTPVTPQAAVGAPPQRPLVDDRPLPTVKPRQDPASSGPPAAVESGPSEFTRIMQGGYSKPAGNLSGEPGAAAGSPSAGGPATPSPSAGGALPVPVAGVSIQQPALPKVHVTKPAVPKTAGAVLGAAEAISPAANARNKKLIIFLSIVIALAIILVIVMAIATKK